MPSLSDATLEAEVLAAAGGDRDAFGRLVSATSAMVTAITLAEARDEELARDAAQDVYLQVWNGLGQLREPGSFLPWLRQAARRQARRLSLQRGRQVRGEGAERALAEAAAEGPGPGERLLDAERAELVRQALEALPDDARETVILYYREGHSTAQVGRLLGLSGPAVQQRLSRARARLREDVLARLGEAVARAAPGGAFTAGVMALLAPRAAEAAALTAGASGALAGAATSPATGLGASLSLVKSAAGVAVLGFLLGAVLLGGRPGGAGPGAPPSLTIARPPGERAASEPRRETPPLEVAAGTASGWLEVQVAAEGAPLAGAAVRAYLRLPFEPVSGGPSWRLAGQAATGADGRALLPASTGSWLLVVRAAGWAPAQVAVVRPSGEETTRADARLERAATLSGRTVDRAGQAVAQATLRLVREAEGLGETMLPPEEEQAFATSDARGAFAIGGLAPGPWRVTAEAAGHARTVLGGVQLPRAGPLLVALDASAVVEGLVIGPDGKPAARAEVTFAGGPELLRVEAGPGGGFAAGVQPGSYRIAARLGEAVGWVGAPVVVAAGAVARGLKITLGAPARFDGRVEDGAGRPIAGAVLLLAPCEASGEVGRALSGADGRFSTPPLAPGEYDLTAHAGGFTPAERKGLVLLAGQRFDLELRLDATGSVTGLVTSPAGAPIAGARVRGGLRWSGGYGEGEAETVTGSDGRYRLDGLQVGETTIRARRPAAPIGSERFLEVKAGEVVAADLVLPGLGMVEGVVRRADGQPLAEGDGATIGPGGNAWSSDALVRPPLGADGRFRVELPAGRWAVATWSQGRWFSMRQRQPFAVEDGAVTRLDLEVPPTAGAEPVVLRIREPGGAPAPGALLWISAPPARMSTVADERGEARFVMTAEGPGREAPYLVTARKGGRRALQVPLPRAATEGEVQLQPGAVLRGRVEGGSRPVGGFTLTFELPSLPEESLDDAVTRRFAGDRFELTDVAAGRARLVVVTGDGRAGRADLELRPGEAAEVLVRVEEAGRLRARPVDGSGQAVRGAYLAFGSHLVTAAPQGDGPATSAVEGEVLEARDLPPGSIELAIGARCREPVRRAVAIRAGETTDLGAVAVGPVAAGCRP